MAVSTVSITGDNSNLTLRAVNLTGASPLEYLSGAFRGSPEERRICHVFLITAGGAKTFEVAFTFMAPIFVEHTVKGVPVYQNIDSGVEVTPVLSIEAEPRSSAG